MGAAAVYPRLAAQRTLKPHLALGIGAASGGCQAQARFLAGGSRRVTMMPSALVHSGPAAATAPPPLMTCSPLHRSHPWRPRRPGSPFWTPQPGCPQQPPRAGGCAAHTQAFRTPSPNPVVLGGASSGDGRVSFFATCHPGLEKVVARELMDLGYTGVEPSKAGVAFRGWRVSDGYAANLWLRSAIRVLVLLAEGELGADPRVGMRGGQALYDMVYGAAPWHELIPAGATFSVEPRLWSCTDISSTSLVWSRVKDAVCDSIRCYRRDKPAPPERGEVADVPLYVSCYRDRVRIFRDMSGNSLHRRGYRDVMHRAALNEAAAAGVLALSGWREAVEAAGDGQDLVLADPMCGSGTFLIEAALIARDIAPGFMRSLELRREPAAVAVAEDAAAGAVGARRGGGGGRRNAALATDAWPFQKWGDYERDVWEREVQAARERVRPPWRGRLLGVDVHEGALSLALRQAKKAGVLDMLELSPGDCGSVVPAATPVFVVCNPPWGGRLDGFADGGTADGGDGEGYGGDGDRDGDDGAALGAVPDDAAAAAALAAGGRRGGAAARRGGGGGGVSPEHEAFLAGAWRSLDGFLYRQCPGASATVVSGNPAAFRYLKLKPTSKNRLVLSGVEVQVAAYKIRDAASRSAALAAAAAAGPTGAADPTIALRCTRAMGTAAVPELPSSAAATEQEPVTVPPAARTLSATTASPAASSSTLPIAARAAAAATAASVPAAAFAPKDAGAASASRRRPGTSQPPPPPQEDYLDADDGYWVN